MADPTFSDLMERYDAASLHYTEMWAPILRKGAQPLLRALAGDGVGRLLDVGTGVGYQLDDLAAACPGSQVLASDPSRGMLACVPPRFARVRMDARAFALRDASVDRVSFVFMLFHLDDPVVALREARRVLRPGGRVGALTWGSDFQSAATRLWDDCLDRHGATPPDPSRIGPDVRLDTAAKLAELLAAAGFASPHAWTEELVHPWEQEALLRHRQNMGSLKARWDSLGPDAARACLEEARRRMGELPPEGFVARCNLVYAIARP